MIKTTLNLKTKLFNCGRVIITQRVNNLIAENIDFSKQVIASLKRHSNGDWGDLDAQDKKANDDALIHGERILSAYNGVEKIWVITEADRSSTTILFPSEY